MFFFFKIYEMYLHIFKTLQIGIEQFWSWKTIWLYIIQAEDLFYKVLLL